MPAKFSHDLQQSRTFRVITALLGSGGMGEVYLATDTKLGRSVGIKLLPEAVTEPRMALLIRNNIRFQI